jgi:hypothetical protein
MSLFFCVVVSYLGRKMADGRIAFRSAGQVLGRFFNLRSSR